MRIRDQKTKAAFVKYLKENPELRFWQALRSFWHVSFIYFSETYKELEGLQDSFYIEADEHLSARGDKKSLRERLFP